MPVAKSGNVSDLKQTEGKTATFVGTTAKSVLVTGATYEKAALDSSKVTASTVGLDVDEFTVTLQLNSL